MNKMTVKKKFLLGTATIIFIFCAVASTFLYYYLEDMVTDEIYRETEIFIGTADATRKYVKDVLRPRMTELLPTGTFIPHAMSTTFVGRGVMNRLQQRFPSFQYKRAAADPMNPVNKADDFELEKLQWFDKNSDVKEWHGLIKKNNRSFYARFRAIKAEKECLICHGSPEDAPPDVKELYGTQGGYNYEVGEVVAADTIYIPVDVSFVRIKEAAWLGFLIALVSLFSLIGLFYILFNRTVVSDLKALLLKFHRIGIQHENDHKIPTLKTGDEIEQLTAAFEETAADLERTHNELKASETKYRNLFESSRDAIIIINRRTQILEINDAGIKLFGFKGRSEAISIESYFQLFWDTRDARKFHKKVKQSGFVQGLEVFMVNREGGKLTVMVSASQRLDENARFDGIEAILRDVTEKKQVEKHLAQTEKLASIGELASGVAHEINNPLGVIKCYANLAAKAKSEDSQLAKDIQIIRKHTDQCQSVVSSLLSFAKTPEPKKTKSYIHKVIDDILSVLEHQVKKSAIVVKRQYDKKIKSITVDEAMIKQVFMNLLLNACQSMPEGGILMVKSTFDERNRRVTIHVADSGIGISEKFIDRIFDPFFSTKGADKGTGLGLSVSYGIIKQHNGNITVQSIPGKGTTFEVTLPVDDEEHNKIIKS
jgi:PAS domain S-box-containing protein